MSQNSHNGINNSDGSSWNPLDLNGDGKDDATDDALRMMWLYQGMKATNATSGSSSRGCCGTGFIVVLIILIPILIIAGVQSCSSGQSSVRSAYRSSGTNKTTKKTKTSGTGSLSGNSNGVTPRTDLKTEEYISGMFPAEGYYVTKTALASWTYDKAKAGDKNQYYKYSYGEFYPKYGFVQIYIIWLSDKGYIAHVNAAGKNKIPSISEGRTTDVYDVTSFSTAEAFYEKYKDKFHGFSEAEQYYNLHDWIKPYAEKYGKPGAGSTSVKTATPTFSPTPTVAPALEKTDTSVKKTSGKSNTDDDPYDAKDYSHPEDFYYDYYDDFWDYEDAEDYWEEHQ